MPGWRIGFCVGNETLIGALARIKSYLDYGSFTPIQVAAIAALEGDQQCVADIQKCTNAGAMYCVMVECDGLGGDSPKSNDVVWAKILHNSRLWGH